jgi:nucleotide-binding universal stress UspA family protein
MMPDSDSVTLQLTTWRPSKILAATDLTPASDALLQYAAALARHFDAYLYAAHVIPPPAGSINSEKEAAANKATRDAAQEKLSTFLKSAQMDGVRHEILLEQGFVLQTIETLIRRYGIEMVVIGMHEHANANEGSAGSWSEFIFRHTDCPVMTVGPAVKRNFSPGETFKNILFATDFGRPSKHSAPYACSLARAFGASLTLLHVLDNASNYSAEGLAVLRETTRVQLLESVPSETKQWCKPDLVVRSGDSASEILDVARSKNIDLIVMGAKSGRTVINHLPKPTTSTVAAHATCPLLTVRA